MTATVEDGFWSEQPNRKWVEGSRRTVPDARKAGYYQLFTRTIIAPGLTSHQSSGLSLEIVPLSDPMRLKRGERFTVQMWFEGQPLAGAKVVADYLNIVEAQPRPLTLKGAPNSRSPAKD